MGLVRTTGVSNVLHFEGHTHWACHSLSRSRTQTRARFINQHSDRHAPGIAKSTICVRRFDDSLNSASHTTYRSWLRSSSMHEPSDLLLNVMCRLLLCHCNFSETKLNFRKKEIEKLERPVNAKMRQYFSFEIDVPIDPFKNAAKRPPPA